jgi:hypothetical protein
MKYAVFRFIRNKNPEQWIIPNKKLLTFMHITKRKVIIPVVLSEHGNICNILFTQTKGRLYAIHQFEQPTTYVFFQPPVTPSDVVLDRLVEMWSADKYALRVNPIRQAQENLYRL